MNALAALFRTRLFLMCTLLPTALAILYFGLIASDVYVSESTFIVHNQEQQGRSPFDAILHGAGLPATDETSAVVQAFMTSRDALQVLDNELHIGAAFASHSVDIFSRFARVPWHSASEYLLLYYRDKVNVTTDSSSSIIALSTRAFSAADAYAMDRRLLELTEARVNQLNENARLDLVHFAAAEVADAQAQDDAATAVLARYRAEASVMDPEKQSALGLELVSRLEDQLLATRAAIAQLEKLAGDNPQLPVLRRQAVLLQQTIEVKTVDVAGGRSNSLSTKAQAYERLSVQKAVAGTILSGAIAALESARNDSRRKLVYLERIAQPSKPDVAMEPNRLRSVVATFLLGLVLWGVASLIVAAVKEHRH